MKSFSQIAEVAVNPATNTPFERAVRAAHPVELIDLPPSMSNAKPVGGKDKTRIADKCSYCEDGECTCEDDSFEGERINESVLVEQYGDVGLMINEIATAWININPKDFDPIALQVLREDIEAIRDYILGEEDESGSAVSFENPDDEEVDQQTPIAPIKAKRTQYNVFEQFMPGKFQLKDGAEISLNDADASLLNKLRGHLSPANVKSLEERVKKNFQSFSEVLEFARTTLDGDDKSK